MRVTEKENKGVAVVRSKPEMPGQDLERAVRKQMLPNLNERTHFVKSGPKFNHSDKVLQKMIPSPYCSLKWFNKLLSREVCSVCIESFGNFFTWMYLQIWPQDSVCRSSSGHCPKSLLWHAAHERWGGGGGCCLDWSHRQTGHMTPILWIHWKIASELIWYLLRVLCASGFTNAALDAYSGPLKHNKNSLASFYQMQGWSFKSQATIFTQAPKRDSDSTHLPEKAANDHSANSLKLKPIQNNERFDTPESDVQMLLFLCSASDTAAMCLWQ